MTPVVTSVQTKGDKAALINMSEGKPVWCPSFETAAKLEIGKPIPSDWTQKDGDYGPQAFPPKDKKPFGGGGATAFRNTKEGQAIEQERMDRRTALMQAVAVNDGDELQRADAYYQWLRQTSGGSTGAQSPASAPESARDSLAWGTDKPQVGPSTATAAPPTIPSTGENDVAQESQGHGEGPGGSCLHLKNVTPTTPAGKPLPAGKVRCSDCGTVFRQ